MATTQSILDILKAKGSEQTRRTYSRHGIPIDRTFGVSMADLKIVEKTIKGQQELALSLYKTGVMDAMYLAGMVADGSKMTKGQLQSWAEGAVGIQMIAETTVPWVAVENAAGHELALEWMKSDNESIACTGWCTYSGLLAVVPDDRLDLTEIEGIIGMVEKEIAGAKNRVKLKMNGFVISAGTYVKPLLATAKDAAQRIGKVSADMGDTACKIPLATEYIAKVENGGKQGQKRKTIRC